MHYRTRQSDPKVSLDSDENDEQIRDKYNISKINKNMDIDENSVSSDMTGESVMSLTSVTMDGNNTCIHNRKECDKCNFYYRPHDNKTVEQKTNTPHILDSTVTDSYSEHIDGQLFAEKKTETDKLKDKKNMVRKNLIESTDNVEKLSKKGKKDGKKSDKKKERSAVEKSNGEKIESKSSAGNHAKSSADNHAKSSAGNHARDSAEKSTSKSSVEKTEAEIKEEENRLTEENKNQEKVIEKQNIKKTTEIEKSKNPLSGRLISANEDPQVQVSKVGKIDTKPKLKNYKVISIPNNTYLAALRQNEQVFIEGYVGKRMYFCSCFFHERYFILTKEGILIYLRNINLREKGSTQSGENTKEPTDNNPKKSLDEIQYEDVWIFSRPRFLDIKEAIDLQRVYKENDQRPYRILIRHIDYDDEMAFREESIRDIWVERISWILNKDE